MKIFVKLINEITDNIIKGIVYILNNHISIEDRILFIKDYNKHLQNSYNEGLKHGAECARYPEVKETKLVSVEEELEVTRFLYRNKVKFVFNTAIGGLRLEKIKDNAS